MKTITQLQKEAKKAKKYIIAAFNPETGGYVFVANKKYTDSDMTEKISHAALYSEGFDDLAIKEKAWSLSTGFDFIAIPA